MHTIFLPNARDDADAIHVEGDEARHATRVKRLGVGDGVRVLDGRGGVFVCSIIAAGRSLELEVRERQQAPRMVPMLRVLSATPKGPRLDKMIDQLSQVGAASWSPLMTALGVVDPGEHKVERTRRIAIESAKQCARAWTMEVNAPITLDQALRADADVIVADAGATAYGARGNREIHLLVGPEGGFTQVELTLMASAGARRASFGPHIMRIETAAVTAAAIILNAERPYHDAYPSAFDPGNLDGE